MTSPLESRVKSALDTSIQTLDADTIQQLQSVRREALNQPKSEGWLSQLTTSYWAPATGVVFCSMVAAMLLLPQTQNTNNTFDQTALFEMLEEPDTLEVLSDPDFYLWVDDLEAQSV